MLLFYISTQERGNKIKKRNYSQPTRKFRVHNPDFLRRIGLCPQNLLNFTNILSLFTYAE